MRYTLVIISLLANFIYAQCDYLSESQCSNEASCEWIFDIESGNCSSLSDGECNSYDGCYLQNNYPGWYDGSWTCEGGTYQIDNSYCQEVEAVECSEMNQLQCNQDTGCEWVEDIEIGNCSSLSENACHSNPECNFDCEMWSSSWCNGCCWGSCLGGTYQIEDNSYCTQSSFILGDANGDGVLNVSDVVLIVQTILSGEYDYYSDYNQDGVINITDIIGVISAILK